MKRFVVLFLAYFVLNCNALWADEKSNTEDIFNDTQAVIYAIWPCAIDHNLVEEVGDIQKLDILGLKRPSIYEDKEKYQKWFENDPNFPFGFKINGSNQLINNLKNLNEEIHSIAEGEDDWGKFVAFKLQTFPDFEMRRYPTFLIILSSHIKKPLQSKVEYNATIKNLLEITQKYFLKETKIAEALSTFRGDWAVYKYPLIVITHINSLDKFHYLMHLVEGMSVDEYWSKEQLIEMGALPHDSYGAYPLDLNIFIARKMFNELLRIIVPNKPPMLDISNWHLSNPNNRHIERLLRFNLFLHVIIPEYIKESKIDVNPKYRDLMQSLSHTDSNKLDELQHKFYELLNQQKNILAKLAFLKKEINTLTSILDDALRWERQSIGKDDFDSTAKSFGEKYAIPLRETDLRSLFIHNALRYDLGPNWENDTRKTLKEKQHTIEKLISGINKNLDNIENQFYQQFNFATTMQTFRESQKLTVLLFFLGIIISNILIKVFEKDIKKIRNWRCCKMKTKFFIAGLFLLCVCVLGCLHFDKTQGLSSGILLFTAFVVCWYSWETQQLRKISAKAFTETTRPFLVFSLKYCSNKCSYNFLLKNVGASFAHSITIIDNTIRCRNKSYGVEIDGMWLIEKSCVEKVNVNWNNFQSTIINNKWGRNKDSSSMALKADWKDNEEEMKNAFGDDFLKLQTIFENSLNVTRVPLFHLPATLDSNEEITLESAIIGDDKNEWLIKPMNDKSLGTITFVFQNVNNDHFFTKIEIFCVSKIKGIAIYSSKVTESGPWGKNKEIKLKA